METTEKTPADVMAAGEYNGIRIAPIGEDGDVLVAFGHHDPAAVAAAMTKMGRSEFGWSESVEPDEVVEQWGHLMTHCEREECSGDPSCDWCADIRSYDGWMSYRDNADGPGRFPIMLADLS